MHLSIAQLATRLTAATLPASQGHSVQVSAINTTRIVLPVGQLYQPPMPGLDILDFPSYSFLIESSNKNQKILWDGGVAKSWQTQLPPAIMEEVVEASTTITVVEDVATVLTNNGVDLSTIDALIWSHHHFDHWGDPTTFPSTTELVVGEGFQANFLPGYPTNQSALVPDSAFQNRTLREIDFTSGTLTIGAFTAIDYFGDGSFYILETPGHTIDHMSALARTTDNTFIFLGSDLCHNGGEFRPTPELPLPENISPCPRDPLPGPGQQPSSCPGAPYVAINPSKSNQTPYFNESIEPEYYDNPPEALQMALNMAADFDSNTDVLVIMAHDPTLLDIIDFYPQTLNNWQQGNWAELGKWRFLANFTISS